MTSPILKAGVSGTHSWAMSSCPVVDFDTTPCLLRNPEGSARAGGWGPSDSYAQPTSRGEWCLYDKCSGRGLQPAESTQSPVGGRPS